MTTAVRGVPAWLQSRWEIEADHRLYLPYMFPQHVRAPFSPHHDEFWQFIWSLRPNKLPDFKGRQRDAFVSIWPRGHAKTTSGELALTTLAAPRMGMPPARRFGVIVSTTRNQANERVTNVGALLTSDRYSSWYPEAAQREVRKYGAGRWSVNHLQTASGFNLRAFGLDSPMRGAQIEGFRPDIILLDDIDLEHDSAYMTRKKVEIITRSILPMGTAGTVVLGLQNLILRGGVFDQLRNNADWLNNRYVSGPHPAIEGFNWTEEAHEGRTRYVITGGRPTWRGFDLERCQQEIDRIGITAFNVEMQHDLRAVSDLVFETFDREVHAWRRKRQGDDGRWMPDLPYFDFLAGGIDYGGEGLMAHKSALCVAGYNIAADLMVILKVWEDNGPGVQDRQRAKMRDYEQEFGTRIHWCGGGDQYRENAELRKMGFQVTDNERVAGAIDRREKWIGDRLGNYRDESGSYHQPHVRYVEGECDMLADQLERLRKRPPDSDEDPGKRDTIKVNDDTIDAFAYAVEEVERRGKPRPRTMGRVSA